MGTIVSTLNSLTPLGLAGGLGYVIYLLVKVKTNHLHGLPDMAASLIRIEQTLGEIRDGINILKGRIL